MTGCPDDATMRVLLSGGLSEPEREAIAIHASSCELCHALLGYLSPGATTADERSGGEELVLQPGTQIGRYTIEKRIGGFDAQEETVAARQLKALDVEHRMIGHRQSIHRQHADEGSDGGAQHRAFEGDRNECRP